MRLVHLNLRKIILNVVSYIPAILAIIFVTRNLIKYTVFNFNGDDGLFFRASQTSSLSEFIFQRLSTWSGRFTPEIFLYLFAPLPFQIWRIFIVLTIVISIFSLSYLTGVYQIKSLSFKTLLILTASLGLYTLPHPVIAQGIFWFSGSFNYLIPTLALINVFAIIKLSLFLENSKWLFLSIPFALIAIFQEQTLVALLIFLLAANLLYYRTHRSVHYGLLIFIVGCIILGGIGIFAPGNHLRYLSEVKTWYPEFTELSFLTKAWRGLERISEHNFNKITGLWLIFQISLCTLIWFHDWQNKLVKKIILSLPLFICLLAIYLPVLGWLQFNVVSNGYLTKPFVNHFPVLILSFTLFSPLLLLTYLSVNKLVNSQTIILYISAITSGLMISFSPTIYASTQRVFFVYDYLIMTIVSFLLVSLFIEGQKNKKLLLVILGSCLSIGIILLSYFNVLNIIDAWREVKQVVFIND